MSKTDKSQRDETEPISIREFKAHLGRCLDRVEEGDSLTIEDRGTPVVELEPPDELDERTRELVERLRKVGIEWSGERFSPPKRGVPVKWGSVAQLLVEDRGEIYIDP